MPGYANPQNLNRYSYVINNPLKYTDPTGHAQSCEDGDICTSPNTTPSPAPGNGGGNNNDDDPDPNPSGLPATINEQISQCINVAGGGCASYFSASLGLDAPTIMMLLGLGLSGVGFPEVGAPLALSGVAFEACAFTATPLCAAVKLLSVNASGTIDQYGNLYLGPQISWGKSILPFVAVSDYFGAVGTSPLPCVPTEAETRDTLSGFSISAGSIATGGVSYSPLASTYQTSYYLDGFPEVFSVNANFNFWIHDFSP